MNNIKSNTKKLALLFFATVISISAIAEERGPRAVYQMKGPVTYLWDSDVDYYARPITLIRTSNTSVVHRLDFYINSYREVCTYWEQQCVRYDNQGRCIQWQNVCARWGYQVSRVPKSIYLDFRAAHAIPVGSQDGYQINIDRQRPAFDGEDWVYTWLKVSAPYLPEIISKRGEYDYTIKAQ